MFLFNLERWLNELWSINHHVWWLFSPNNDIFCKLLILFLGFRWDWVFFVCDLFSSIHLHDHALGWRVNYRDIRLPLFDSYWFPPRWYLIWWSINLLLSRNLFSIDFNISWVFISVCLGHTCNSNGCFSLIDTLHPMIIAHALTDVIVLRSRFRNPSNRCLNVRFLLLKNSLGGSKLLNLPVPYPKIPLFSLLNIFLIQIHFILYYRNFIY